MFTDRLSHMVFKSFSDNDIASTEVNSHKIVTKHDVENKIAFLTGVLCKDPKGRACYLHTIDKFKRGHNRVEVSGISSQINERHNKIGRYIYIFTDFEVKKYGNISVDKEATTKWVELMEQTFGSEYTRAYNKHLKSQSEMER